MGTENNRPRRYWASRPDRGNLDYFWTELQKGRMRQGWGNDDSQNLGLILEEMQKGGEWWGRLSEDQLAAYRNYPFHPGWGDDTMRQEDIVLIPNMPTFGSFALIRLIDNDYHFDIPKEGGYGHWRKVDFLTPDGVVFDHEDVPADIRSTLRCRSRIWRIDQVGECIENLLKLIESEKFKGGVHFSPNERLSKIISKAKEAARGPAREAARQEIESLLDAEFHGSEFEVAVQLVLEKLFFGAIEHLTGPLEFEHGTDLLIRIDNPLGEVPFIIPVQVKKHSGESDDGVDQLEKAATYWKNKGQYSGHLIGLALITTATSIESVKSRLAELQRDTGFPCYLISRKELVELFVDAAGDRVW